MAPQALYSHVSGLSRFLSSDPVRTCGLEVGTLSTDRTIYSYKITEPVWHSADL